MARQREQDQGIGEDSFLDTIANLVGILIIFVVIIVTRSQSNALAVAQKEVASQQALRDQPLQDAISLQKEAPRELVEDVIAGKVSLREARKRLKGAKAEQPPKPFDLRAEVVKRWDRLKNMWKNNLQN